MDDKNILINFDNCLDILYSEGLTGDKALRKYFKNFITIFF